MIANNNNLIKNYRVKNLKFMFLNYAKTGIKIFITPFSGIIILNYFRRLEIHCLILRTTPPLPKNFLLKRKGK
jgi:hypothetical protein